MGSSPDVDLAPNPQFSSYPMLRCKLYDVVSLYRLSGRFASAAMGVSCVQCLAGFYDGAHRLVGQAARSIPHDKNALLCLAKSRGKDRGFKRNVRPQHRFGEHTITDTAIEN
jgi:hypothetical protein